MTLCTCAPFVTACTAVRILIYFFLSSFYLHFYLCFHFHFD